MPLQSGSVISAKSERLTKPWSASEKLLPFLGEWESGVLNGKYRGMPVEDGMILQVYNDHPEKPSINKPTVGLGHVVLPSDHLQVGQKITSHKAKELLKKDLKTVEEQVNKRVQVPLFQHEYDALVSIGINAGPYGGLEEICKNVNTGNYKDIPKLITHYHAKTEGKLKRRASEAKLFAEGLYESAH